MSFCSFWGERFLPPLPLLPWGGGWQGNWVQFSQLGLSCLAHSSQMVAQTHMWDDCITLRVTLTPHSSPCAQTVCSDPAFISGQRCHMRKLAEEGKICEVSTAPLPHEGYPGGWDYSSGVSPAWADGLYSLWLSDWRQASPSLCLCSFICKMVLIMPAEYWPRRHVCRLND